MPEQDEFEVLQRLTQARDAGDLRAELEALRQLRQSRPAAPAQPQVPPPSIGRRAAARFLANVISTPEAVGDLLEIGGAGLQAVAGAGRGSIGERFQAAR